MRKNKVPQTVECHVPSMDVSAEGIQDYYWPVSDQERTGFGFHLMQELSDILKAHSSDQALPYKFLATRLAAQTVAVFQGDLLAARTRNDGVNIYVPEDWGYWPYLLQSQTPPEPTMLSLLINGPHKINYSKKLFRLGALKKISKLLQFKKQGAQIDGLKIKPLTQAVLQNDIIATQRTALVVEHAQTAEKDVVFCRSNRWFEAVTHEELETSLMRNDPELEQKIIEMIEAGYRQCDIELPQHSREFITNFMRKGAAALRVHYERLLEKPQQLPREIWTGTTGVVWDTMLRVAAMQNGAVVTAHDHGSGWAYLTHKMRGFNELWGAQYFATFNQNHADEMAATQKIWPHFDQEMPKIISAQDPSAKKEIQHIKPAGLREVKTIFLMIALYDNDRGRTGPGNTNNFLVDWQARLIKNLRDLGYEVVVKIHPETKIMPPEMFETQLGATVTKEPFTDLMHQADLVIFDCIYSTAFTDALATNLPILLIDFFGWPWTDNGLKLIEKRCKIFKAGYENCRAMPDWNELAKAIKAAPEKSDNHEFYTHYFL